MGIGVKRDDEEADIIADINVTPFIDIMLVLLIIFMMTSSVSFKSGVDINIPTSSSAAKGKKKEGVLVSLDIRGNLFVDGVKSNRANLKANITKARTLLDAEAVRQEDAPTAEIIPLTLREPCPECGGTMRIVETFRRGEVPQSRAPPRKQAA